MRVNGTAEFTTDRGLCEELAVGDKPARVVVVVTVAEIYVHGAKALRRADLWSSGAWPGPGDVPSAACIVKDHASLDAEVAAIEDAREENLRATLWAPGGADGPDWRG